MDSAQLQEIANQIIGSSPMEDGNQKDLLDFYTKLQVEILKGLQLCI